jgi:ComF family protein
MKNWLQWPIDTLLPRHCILCGYASGTTNICAPCSDELPRIGACCRKCALPLVHPEDRVCGPCRKHAVPWNSAIAALVYGFPVDELIRRFKFSRSLACGQLLAQELTRAVANRCIHPPDAIVPVPLHRTRFLARAFNQSELLARHTGKSLEIPVYPGLLCRRRRTRAHSGLDAISRRINIKGAFRCRLTSSQRDDVRHVALVDDVLTTGATLSECTRALQAAGIRKVSIWVAARAPEPQAQPDE